MILRIKLTPNSSQDEVIGWEDDPTVGRYLRIRLKAPPVEGKANQALVKFIAKQLSLSKSAVLLEKGQTSRFKTLSLPDSANLRNLN